jgi:AcrR family transcriptional regulator
MARTSTGPVQALRADAKRNRDALVAAAAAVFATAGVDAAIKDIADHAGVGVGTFYRHFPTRADLIVAVYHHEVDRCVVAAKDLAALYGPFEALTRWIDRFLDLVATKRGLAAAIQSDAPGYAALRADFEARLVPALEGLMEGARGEVRATISAAELWRAVALLCAHATPDTFLETRRMVALLVNGLRVPSSRGEES